MSTMVTADSCPSRSRLHERVRLRTWVKLMAEGTPHLLGHIEDISPSGLGLLHATALPCGQQCEVYFALPWQGRERLIEASAHVTACEAVGGNGQYHIGLAFLSFRDDDAAALIADFVRLHQA